ncbi:MAG TPA: SprB repeat-containing protein, partial [Chitinophagaceae bacterium]|nr:SprB repeat-containing protein [Chitinophagaceae bacterium]
MKLKLLTLLTFISCFLFLSGPLKAQSCIPTNINGTTINLLCNQVCSTLVFQIPHIKGTGDYIVSSIPYNPYPYTVAFSNAMPETYVDDVYGYLQTMPFNFCFYDSIYNQFVAGSNGLLTFDIANKSIPPPPVVPPCGNSYNQNFPIPYISNNICSGSAAYYPKASIMGMFTDLYPVASACPPDRKIAWHIEGTAPCRKLVLNYYHVGMFGNGDWSINGTNCNSLNPTTFQIVLHESTGLIEVNIEKKGCNGTVGTGYNAILGVQDWTRTKAVAAPGKNATIWNETNTAYRFTPSGPGSRFVSSELYTLPGVFVMTADTLTTVAGLLDVRFNNACFPAGSNQFVVKSIFSACDNPINQLISYDTITVNRLNSLGATATTTNASCGPPNGTITVTIPFGIGNPPYTYVLDGGAPVVAPSPYTFTNVASGPHVITVTDASAGCNSTINVTVNLSGNIPATTTASATSCAGVNNGSITIISAGPGTGPYLLFLDGGPPVATASLPYTFSNLSAGNHTLLVTDQGLGCSTVLMNVNVPTGIGITGFVTTTATSCTGAANGTITATALSGVPPFTWQLDGGPVLPGTSPYTFTNVSAGAHIVRITDNLGCISGFNANVAAGPGINGSTTSTATTCPAASNGSITATALSGTAPFTWSLDGA